MKTKIFTLLFLLLGVSSFYGQEHETVLTAPDNWKKEIIPFPINFASSIDLVGFEDLRFAPNWSDAKSENFWTYMFVWYVEPSEPMTEALLTEYFNSYYDGLMGVNMKGPDGKINPNQLDKTICLFIKTEEGFKGKMRVYDNFFTKEYMVLNIHVTESFCPKSNKQIIRCDISQQDFNHNVWSLFESVKLKEKC